MGFRKPDLLEAYNVIRSSLAEIKSSYNDGYTAANCKQELYQLKCWLEDQYESLPTFSVESEWEQERLVQLLKKDHTK